MTIDTTKVNIFEEASRMKLRFNTVKGTSSVEDLWTLPITHPSNLFSLDTILTEVKTDIEKLEKNKEEITNKYRGETEFVLHLKLEIVKAVIARKEADEQAILDEKNKKAQLEELDRLIDEKSKSELSNKSIDELKAMREELLK